MELCEVYSSEERVEEATIVEENAQALVRPAHIVPRSYACNDTGDEDSVVFPRNRFVEPHRRTLDHADRSF